MKLTQSLADKLKWTMRIHVVYQILFISHKFYTFDWPRMSTISKPPNSKKAFNNRGLNNCTHHNQLQWFSALKLGFWQNPYSARCICEYTAANMHQPAKQRRIGNKWVYSHFPHCHIWSLTKAIAGFLYYDLQETNSSFKSKGMMITEQRNTLQPCKLAMHWVLSSLKEKPIKNIIYN